jgi:CysZ protein
MIDAVLKAARQTLSPPFRAVLLKSLAITVATLIAAWFALDFAADRLLTLQNATLNQIAHIVAGFGVAFGLLFLIAPVTAAVAGLFLDDVAEIVERTHYPGEPAGAPLPLARSLWLSLRFALVVLGLNLLMLPLLFLPGINLAVWLGVNGYLLSREYFSMAALRFRSEADVTALRRRNRLKVFLGGLVVAGLAVVPFANLLTPLFATAFFVHLHKRVSADEATRLRSRGPANLPRP